MSSCKRIVKYRLTTTRRFYFGSVKEDKKTQTFDSLVQIQEQYKDSNVLSRLTVEKLVIDHGNQLEWSGEEESSFWRTHFCLQRFEYLDDPDVDI